LDHAKTKPPHRVPRIKTDAAQAPKELMRRSLLSARKQAQDAAEPHHPQDEQPERYAEERIEQAAAKAAHSIGNETAYRAKRLMLKASHRIKQNRQSQGGTEQSRPSFYSAENNTVRQGREYARRNAQVSRRTAQSTPQSIKQSAEPSKAAAKGTVKTIRRGVKAAQHTVKTTERTVKTTQHAAKAAQRTAQATAKAAQTAGRTAQLAVKVTATTAKAAVKTIAAIIKAIISAIKELVRQSQPVAG
jgi:paraquat-inducible protein B